MYSSKIPVVGKKKMMILDSVMVKSKRMMLAQDMKWETPNLIHMLLSTCLLFIFLMNF